MATVSVREEVLSALTDAYIMEKGSVKLII